MITGFNSDFKDRRIDKMLDSKGYNYNEIFYSPIKIWVFFSLLLIIMVFPIVIYVYQISLNYIMLIPYLLVPYLVLSYLLAAYLNNSFVIIENKLLIINPNYPFRKIQEYKISEIKDIKIAQDFWLTTFLIFGVFGRNYLEINYKNKRKKFFCASLEIDCFDENQTKLTLDDLHIEIKKKNIPVKFLFD